MSQGPAAGSPSWTPRGSRRPRADAGPLVPCWKRSASRLTETGQLAPAPWGTGRGPRLRVTPPRCASTGRGVNCPPPPAALRDVRADLVPVPRVQPGQEFVEAVAVRTRGRSRRVHSLSLQHPVLRARPGPLHRASKGAGTVGDLQVTFGAAG